MNNAMLSKTAPRLVVFFAVGLPILIWSPTDTRACGFHGLLGDGFGASHAESLTVAFAVRDAIDAGVMDKSVLLSALSGKAGYARAVRRLGAFQHRFSEGTATAPRPISLLLVDSTLWSRLSPTRFGYEIATHTAGPHVGDVVIVTHEEVLAALVSGDLSIATALDRRLLVVDGESRAAHIVRRLLGESFGG